jgi:hypothetical protein
MGSLRECVIRPEPAGTMMSENKSWSCEIACSQWEVELSHVLQGSSLKLQDVMTFIGRHVCSSLLFNGSQLRSVEGLSLSFLIISLVDRFPMSWFIMDVAPLLVPLSEWEVNAIVSS